MIEVVRPPSVPTEIRCHRQTMNNNHLTVVKKSLTHQLELNISDARMHPLAGYSMPIEDVREFARALLEMIGDE